MSLISIFGIGFLLLWAVASACYAFRIPGLHTALKRINWFLPFAHWTMFSAGPDPTRHPGVYEIQVREAISGSRGGGWRTVASGHHWAFHGFIANPPRHLAACIHTLGQRIDSVMNHQTSTDAREELQRSAALIAECFGDVETSPASACEYRLVKRYGPRSGTPERVVWQFTAEKHAADRG